MVVKINKQKANKVLQENNICGLIMDIKIEYPNVAIVYYCLRTHTSNMVFTWNTNPCSPQQAPNSNIIQQESK